MTKPINAQVAIVGGGIMGASAALALRKRGVHVVMIERDVCGSRSSGVNYGGVRRQGRSIAQLHLAQLAHEIWGLLPSIIGIDGEYVRSGHLKLARTEADMALLTSYRDRSVGFDLGLQLFGSAEIRARWPWLDKGFVGGSFCPEDGHANPRLVSPAFAQAARQLGAEVIENTKVERASHDGRNFTLECAGGIEVRSEILINCAGAWAGELAAQFGEDVPMMSAHPVMAVTEPLPQFMNLSLGMEGGGIYGRQVTRGNCVIGGTRGYALDCDRARASSDAIISVMRQALELLPALKHAHVIRTWSGTEGYISDRQPVISPSGTTPGLFHAFGFCGAGFQVGPAVGEVLSELVCDGKSATPIETFSIARFPGFGGDLSEAKNASPEKEGART